MKKTLIITIAIVLLSSVICSACSQNTSQNPESLSAIRSATVLITMQAPNPDQTIAGSTFLEYGVGSLIQYRGEILLVTHNHWRNMQDVTIVKFFDADNNLIKVIIKDRFVESIVYSDAGALVIKPPKEVSEQLSPVSLQAVPQVKAGETVDMVYRENPAREKAAILTAVVEEVTTYNDHPVYKLRCPDGQTIQPGDSGGGIWYKGILVANNWTVTARSTITPGSSYSSEETNTVYTNISYAANLSEDLP